MKKGTFITLYGINNIGKSTHAKRLVARLEQEGHKAHYLKYPIYDIEPTGPFLNRTLRSSEGQKISEDELQLWFVLNRYQYQSELMRMLEEGVIVVAEDYIGTGIAWGTAKGLEEEWGEEVNKHLLREDLAIMIEGERDIRAAEEVHVHEQNEELIGKCMEVHQHLAKKHGWRKVQLQERKEDTAALIWNVVDDFLRERYS